MNIDVLKGIIKTYTLVSVLFYVQSQGLIAQTPTMLWNNALGGSGHEDAQCILETTDHKILAAGHTHSSNQQVAGYKGIGDLWVVCLNQQGDLIWQRCYGGSLFDEAKAMIETADGHFVLTGFSESSDQDVSVNYGTRDVWVIKIDSQGTLLWEHSFGGSGVDIAYDLVETKYGDLVITGYSEYADGTVSQNHGHFDAWVLRLNAQGNLIWEKSYGGSAEDMGKAIQETEDGGFVIAGHAGSTDVDVSENKGYLDAWVFKIDSNGTLLWEKTFGGNDVDRFYSLTKIRQGHYVVSGETSSSDGDISIYQGGKDAFLVCIDSTGNMIWNKTFGGGSEDIIYSSVLTENSHVLLGGMTGSLDGDVLGQHGLYDAWLLKIDSLGNLIWQACYGEFSLDLAYKIATTHDKSILMAGQTLYAPQSLTGNHGAEDVWVLKLSSEMTEISETSNQTQAILLHPNPTSNILTIQSIESGQFEIYSITGQLVSSQNITQGVTQKNIFELSLGTYITRFISANGVNTSRIVVGE